MPTTADVVREKPRVFLSYSFSDKAHVERLRFDLAQHGFAVVAPEDVVEPGESITREIGEAISSADAVAVFLSRASNQSPWVSKEISLALAQQAEGTLKRIVPVLLEPNVEIPPFLRDIKYIDLSSTRDYARNLNTFIQALKTTGSAGYFDDDALNLRAEMLIAEIEHLRAQQLEFEVKLIMRGARLRWSLTVAVLSTILMFDAIMLVMILEANRSLAYILAVISSLAVLALFIRLVWWRWDVDGLVQRHVERVKTAGDSEDWQP